MTRPATPSWAPRSTPTSSRSPSSGSVPSTRPRRWRRPPPRWACGVARRTSASGLHPRSPWRRPGSRRCGWSWWRLARRRCWTSADPEEAHRALSPLVGARPPLPRAPVVAPGARPLPQRPPGRRPRGAAAAARRPRRRARRRPVGVGPRARAAHARPGPRPRRAGLDRLDPGSRSTRLGSTRSARPAAGLDRRVGSATPAGRGRRHPRPRASGVVGRAAALAAIHAALSDLVDAGQGGRPADQRRRGDRQVHARHRGRPPRPRRWRPGHRRPLPRGRPGAAVLALAARAARPRRPPGPPCRPRSPTCSRARPTATPAPDAGRRRGHDAADLRRGRAAARRAARPPGRAPRGPALGRPDLAAAPGVRRRGAARPARAVRRDRAHGRPAAAPAPRPRPGRPRPPGGAPGAGAASRRRSGRRAARGGRARRRSRPWSRC